MDHEPYGMTLQLQVADVGRARDFYTRLFGRPPQFQPHEDFLEWPVVLGGETWVQVVGVPGPVRPLLNRVRFGVRDLPAARTRLVELGTEVSALTTLPGVVAFVDFADPWGNQLGYYQDLQPSGAQPTVGGSAHDDGLFVTG